MKKLPDKPTEAFLKFMYTVIQHLKTKLVQAVNQRTIKVLLHKRLSYSRMFLGFGIDRTTYSRRKGSMDPNFCVTFSVGIQICSGKISHCIATHLEKGNVSVSWLSLYCVAGSVEIVQNGMHSN